MGFRVVFFAGLTLRVGPGGIEIPQAHEIEWVGCAVILQDFFHHELAFAVWTDGLLRVFFVYGYPGRDAIGRAGGRENEMFYAVGRSARPAG